MTKITAKDIKKAIKVLKEMSKKPILVRIETRAKFWNEISPTVYNYSLYSGVPVYLNKHLPKNIVRLVMSDGTSTFIDISEKPKFI